MSKDNPYKRAYQLNHEVLPYNIELKLPFNVIDNIYSYLRPKYQQRPRNVKIERLAISINHRMTTLNEIMEIRRKKREARKKCIEQLTKIETILESILSGKGSKK